MQKEVGDKASIYQGPSQQPTVAVIVFCPRPGVRLPAVVRDETLLSSAHACKLTCQTLQLLPDPYCLNVWRSARESVVHTQFVAARRRVMRNPAADS
jgi:hypothetical protein